MKKTIVEILVNLMGGIIGAGLLLGIFAIIGNCVEWVCADKGRFILSIVISGYVLYRMFKAELDK